MLSPEDLEQYEEQGYLLIEDGLRPAEVECLNKRAKALFAQDSADRIMEKDGKTVRGVHGCHERDQVCHDLVRHPRILGPARQILGGEVYVHQFKINAKMPVSGDLWPWHQDYTFWQREDGMARPQVVNLAVLLDDATDVNGALLFVPGSHQLGVIDTNGAEKKPETDEFWATHLSADLEYTIDAAALSRIVPGRGIHSATGPAGSVLIFDACIVHGSGTNMSPNPRGMAMITYNRTSNALPESARPRPEFLAARAALPVQPYAEDFVLADRAPSLSS